MGYEHPKRPVAQLVAFLVVLIGGVLATQYSVARFDGGTGPDVYAVATFFAAAVTLVGLILSIIGLVDLMRFNRAKKPEVQRQQILAAGGPDSSPDVVDREAAQAYDLYHRLMTGAPVPREQSPTIPMQAGEEIYRTGRVQYSRFYGQELIFTQGSTVISGRPSVLIGAAIGNAMRASSQRRQAQAAAQPDWREVQFLDVWVTNQRIIAYAGGRWLEFWYGAIMAIHPDPETFSLVLEFRDTSPLKLTGPAVASIAVLVQYFATGAEGLQAQPAFQRYRAPGASPGTEMENRS
ncbi:hypothetical protein ACIGDM_12985 [Rothia koreensis]|uniref:hypothetical protein n=1 Tax=Rothia koreensis TaxID=592378 RepID=UPI0037C6AB2B